VKLCKTQKLVSWKIWISWDRTFVHGTLEMFYFRNWSRVGKFLLSTIWTMVWTVQAETGFCHGFPKHIWCSNKIENFAHFLPNRLKKKPFAQYSARITVGRTALHLCWLLLSTFIILSWPNRQFSFEFMHILQNSSWCDWECTAVLWCLSCKIHRKSWERRQHCTSILFFPVYISLNQF